MVGLGLLILLGLAIEYWKVALAILIAVTVIWAAAVISRADRRRAAAAVAPAPPLPRPAPPLPTRPQLAAKLARTLDARRAQMIADVDHETSDGHDRLIADLERLAELHAARDLTDTEYATAKARLLH